MGDSTNIIELGGSFFETDMGRRGWQFDVSEGRSQGPQTSGLERCLITFWAKRTSQTTEARELSLSRSLDGGIHFRSLVGSDVEHPDGSIHRDVLRRNLWPMAADGSLRVVVKATVVKV